MQLSLDPIEKPQSNKESTLAEQIIRITQERGSFADITQESLEQEIKQASLDADSTEPEADTHELPQFEEKRALMAAKIRSALNESALSLDFVSLLVSCLHPQAGASSMSPMLKGQVPIGTLSGDTISQQSVMPTLSQNRGDPGYGWKLMALDDATKKLEDAVQRLNQETAKEQKFWDQALGLIEQGEKIYKYKRSLRIRYGYRDCGSKFIASGQGFVERAADGDLKFSPDSPPSHKVVCVTVHKNDQVNGRAYCVCPSDSPVVQARHFLFEDELFFFLVEEARQLSGHRVTLTDNGIVCQLYEYVVEISSVELADLEREVPQQDESSNGPLANVICNSLHLLLNERHSRNLQRSHSVPPPLDSKNLTRAPQQPLLLKPILAQIQQSVAEKRAKKLVEMMLPEAIIQVVKPNNGGDKSPVEMLEECPTTKLDISGPQSITLTINSPLEPRETFEAEAKGLHSKFYDLAELELWLRSI